MQGKAPLARLVANEVLQEAAGRKDPIPKTDVTNQEKGSPYIDFLIPGLIGLNIMGSSMWSIGFNLVVARKRKLLRRYAVTPMKRSQFLLAYFYTRLLALVLELGLLVTFGALLFGTTVQGSPIALVVLAILGAASFAGISLIIGARLENSETASGWMNLVQLPMWVLSGTFFSYERFPDAVHPLIELLPLTALVNGLRAVYNDGAGLLQLGPQVLVLGAWGIVGYVVALRTFRWQ
jgi:ABC-type multidrug transport system permease subunit